MTGAMVLWLVVFVPLAGAVAAWAFGARAPRAPRWIALGSALAQTLMTAGLAESSGLARPAGAASWSTLNLDGLSLPFVLLTGVIGLAAASASWRVTRRPGHHFALLMLVQAGVALVFLADDLVLFYIAWESVLLPMFLLIGGWGSAEARRAATKFLVFTFAGGAVLLAGVILTLLLAGDGSISGITRAGGLSDGQDLAFWLLAIGMLVKLPVVPVHTWLPDAHTEAPTAGSIVLAGVLLKMGGYGLIRVAVPVAPAAFDAMGVVLVCLGGAGVVWGAAAALVQTDLKRLVAYSSVAHMGFAAVAIGLGTQASLAAAVTTMVSHGLVAGLLFYLVGALYERAHTRDITRFGGLGSIAPKWSVAFVFASLASAGLPGLSGFPGEFVTSLEAYAAFGWWVLVLGMGVALAAAYNLRAVQGSVQGPRGAVGDVPDLSARETFTVVAFGAGIVALGVAPRLVTEAAASVLGLIAGGGVS